MGGGAMARQARPSSEVTADPVAVELDDLAGRRLLDGLLAGDGFDVADADAVLLGDAMILGSARWLIWLAMSSAFWLERTTPR